MRMFNSQNWKLLRKRAKPTIAEGTAQATANSTITGAGFKVGTVGTTATQNVGLNGVVLPALTDSGVAPLGTSINYNIGVFSPPTFFGPPGFFAPPAFFAPPNFK